MGSVDSVRPVCVVSLAREGFARVRAYGLNERDEERVVAFDRALDGTRYVREQGAHLTPVDCVPTVLVRLKEAGFELTIEPDVRALIEARERERFIAVSAAKERVELIDERLYQVTLARDGVGSKLFPYQRVGVAWLAGRRAALLADEMRLGKSLQIIAAIPDDAPVFIVAPAAVKGVWRAQIARWRPDAHVTVLAGRRSFRWPEPREWIVVNYDILPPPHVDGCDGFLPEEPCGGCDRRVGGTGATIRVGHLPDCKGAMPRKRCGGCNRIFRSIRPGTIVVGDEAQALKTPKSRRTMSFRTLASAARAVDGASLLVTGTPLENEPPELWSLLTCAGLAEEAYGSYARFCEVFGGERAPFKYPGQKRASMIWREPTPEAAERLRRVMLRRLRNDVLPDLPRKTYGDVLVDLIFSHLREIDQLVAATGRSIDEIVALVESTASKGPSFHEFSAVRAALAIVKVPALLDYITALEENDGPLIVFSAHRAPVDVLARRPGWAVVTGSETSEERTDAVARFQAGELRGIALTIRAGGTGIELSRGSHVIFVDRDWNPAANAQAEDRPMGLNQKRGVTITALVAAHELDMRINAVLARKLLMIAATVDRATAA